MSLKILCELEDFHESYYLNPLDYPTLVDSVLQNSISVPTSFILYFTE